MTADNRAPAGAQETWELIRDPLVSQLVFAYEMVLTEMRTYAKAGDRTIAEWVRRLDFERDEFVNQMLAPQPQPDRAALVDLLAEAYAIGHWDGSAEGYHFDHKDAKAHFLADMPRYIAARVARALSAPAGATGPDSLCKETGRNSHTDAVMQPTFDATKRPAQGEAEPDAWLVEWCDMDGEWHAQDAKTTAPPPAWVDGEQYRAVPLYRRSAIGAPAAQQGER